MRTSKWIKLNNKGASLIAVLVTLAVVSIIGVVISKLTVTNIQLRDMEQRGKTSFYSTEKMMDHVTSGLSIKASSAMKEAYTEMLSQYQLVADSKDPIDDKFAEKYLNKLISYFRSNSATYKPYTKKDGDGKIIYECGYYNLSKVKAALKSYLYPDGVKDDQKEEYEAAMATIISKPVSDKDAEDQPTQFYYADYENHIFVLEGITVAMTDEGGFYNVIKTDIVFHTPDIASLRGNRGTFREFMRYCLIADTQILTTAKAVNVKDNVYAGYNGITTKGLASATFSGYKTITTGDIAVNTDGELVFGDFDDLRHSRIFAENLRTNSTGGTSPAQLTVSGQAFISDDTEMDGENETITLIGEYYGYNFKENYKDSAKDLYKELGTKDAKYSSCIALNGKKCNLNIEKLTKLYVAGRTFIGRSNGVTGSVDIPLGESISAKSNQQVYWVPVECVNDKDSANPTLNEEKFKAYLGIDDPSFSVTNYIDMGVAGNQLIKTYHSGSSDPYFYLNFKSESDASSYYYKVYSYVNRRRTLNSLAGTHLDDNALQINGSGGFIINGAALLRKGTELVEQRGRKDERWLADGDVFDLSSRLAAKYLSLQMYLEDSHDGINPRMDNIRLENKDSYSMFDVIINRDKFDGLMSRESDKFTTTWKPESKPEDPTPTEKTVLIIRGGYAVTKPFEGLIVASGDVTVGANVKGTILAGGTITLSGPGASIEADEETISAMIESDIALGDASKYAFIFNGYDLTEEQLMGGTSISKYITYDNWSKAPEYVKDIDGIDRS